MSTLGKLMFTLSANTSRFERDMNKAARIADRQGKQIKSSLAVVGKVGAAAAVAGAGLVAMAGRAALAADEIAKTSKAAGLSAETLQELRFAGERSGVALKQVDEGTRRLNRRIGLAAAGTGEWAKKFSALGIEVRDVNGQVKSTEAIFNEAVVLLGDMSTASERAAAASDLFGEDAGPKLALLLAEGEESVRKLREEKRQLGVVSNEAAAAAEKTADQWTNTSAKFEAGAQTLLLKLLPAVNKSIEGISLLADFAIDAADAVEEMAINLGLIESSDELERLTKQWTDLHPELREAETLLARQKKFGDAYADSNKELESRIRSLNRQIDRVTKARGELLKVSKENVKSSKEEEATLKSTAPAWRLFEQATDELTDAIKANEEASRKRAEAIAAATPPLKDTDAVTQQFAATTAELTAFLVRQAKTIEEVRGVYADLDDTIEELNLDAIPDKLDEGTRALDGQKEAAERAAQAYEELARQSQAATNAIATISNAFGTNLPQQVNSFLGGQFANLFGQSGVDALGFLASGSQIGTGLFGNQSAGIGGALGGLVQLLPGVGQVGGFVGSIVGSLLGDLLSDEDDPRIRLVNNLTNQGGFRVQEEAQFRRNSAFGFTIAGQQITEEFGAAAAGQFLDSIQDFDDRIASLLNPEQIERVFQAFIPGGNSETSTLFEGDISVEEALRQRFQTIAGALDGNVGRFVQQFADDLEQGVQALVNITRVNELLDVNPLETFADVLARADEGPLDTLGRLGDELSDLTSVAFDSVEGMAALGQGLQQYNEFVVQSLVGIENARRGIEGITGSTIDNLTFQTLDNNGQFEFLTRRANDLSSGIGGLGSAAEVQNQVALINQLASQAFGLLDPEQQRAQLDTFTRSLQGTEADAQARLDVLEAEVRAQAEADRQATADAVRNGVVEGTQDAGFVAAGAQILDASARFAQSTTAFGQGVNVLVSNGIPVFFEGSEVG